MSFQTFTTPTAPGDLQPLFNAQRDTFISTPAPGCHERINDLQRLGAALRRYETQIINAIHADFGSRSTQETQLADIGAVLQAIRYTCKHLPRWMKKKRCPTDFSLWPAKAYTLAKPKGVVGIIAPWNFPVHLSLLPLVDALAAGNRVMLKPSELTPYTATLLAIILGECFSQTQVCLVLPDTELQSAKALAEAFANLPFDHLLFTGSTQVGRKIAQATAANLTPVTLELGGKSPLIVGDDIPLARAAEMIGIAKLFNAGQTCIAPDYLLVPRRKINDLAIALMDWAKNTYPDICSNNFYTSLISAQHFQRLQALRDDVQQQGTKTVAVEMIDDKHQQTKKFPLTLIIEPALTSRVMQEEIFGPLLPIIGYDEPDEITSLVRSRPSPLAAYALFQNTKKAEQILQQILSGSSSVNAPLLQQTVNSLPFGGVGASGMGAYHGENGFFTFSHNQSFMVTPSWHLYRYIKPPFGIIFRVFKRLLFR